MFRTTSAGYDTPLLAGMQINSFAIVAMPQTLRCHARSHYLHQLHDPACLGDHDGWHTSQAFACHYAGASGCICTAGAADLWVRPKPGMS